jgi:Animal haem peroxidase
MAGFRHFMAEDKLRDGHRWRPDEPEHLRRLMKGLAWRMDHAFAWPDHAPEIVQRIPDIERWENPHLPSGYTYLMQLVAHDLVATSFPISVFQDATAGARNSRAAALRLETIYGDGPLAAPLIYAPDANSHDTRTALRLGPTQEHATEHGRREVLRDIARMPSLDAGSRGLPTEPLIADPRNDDTPILAQLTALFHILHNAILDLLPEADSRINTKSRWEAAYRRFVCARGAVTLIYRRIIREDLLPRILDPEIHARYATHRPPFVDVDDGRVPLEFSHAVFRFGHAMVRSRYRMTDSAVRPFELDEVLRHTSLDNPLDMPLNKRWIIQWSHFFGIDGKRPNFAQRIGPHFSPYFTSAFPKIDSGRSGLAYRDLIGESFLDLWTVPGLIAAIDARAPGLLADSRLLARHAYRDAIRDYLAAKPVDLSATDIETLAADPPLSFFTVFEAAGEPGAGFRLGRLGSVLVAEVIFAALARDPVIGEGPGLSLAAGLQTLSRHVYGADFLSEVPEISTMSELIGFIAELRHLRMSDYPFV